MGSFRVPFLTVLSPLFSPPPVWQGGNLMFKDVERVDRFQNPFRWMWIWSGVALFPLVVLVPALFGQPALLGSVSTAQALAGYAGYAALTSMVCARFATRELRVDRARAYRRQQLFLQEMHTARVKIAHLLSAVDVIRAAATTLERVEGNTPLREALCGLLRDISVVAGDISTLMVPVAQHQALARKCRVLRKRCRIAKACTEAADASLEVTRLHLAAALNGIVAAFRALRPAAERADAAFWAMVPEAETTYAALACTVVSLSSLTDQIAQELGCTAAELADVLDIPVLTPIPQVFQPAELTTLVLEPRPGTYRERLF